jgi:hypothetical protein
MKLFQAILPAVAALAIGGTGPSSAQTMSKTKVTTDTDVKGGVATDKVKVVNVQKRKTHRPKRILGVKVGHKTAKVKTVKETARSSNGDTSATVKTKTN